MAERSLSNQLLTGNFGFTADGIYDIGAGSTRPRDLILSRDLTAGGSVIWGAMACEAQGVAYISTTSVTSNSAATVSLLGTGVGTKIVPAGFLNVGRTLRLRLSGYLTTTASPSTLLFTVKLGTVTVATSNGGTALAPTASMTVAKPWVLECDIPCRSVGAAGTVFALGRVVMSAAAAAALNAGNLAQVIIANGATPAAATIDTTAAQTLDLTVTNSGTGTTLVCTGVSLEVVG